MIVEDQLSAIRASAYVNAVALLSTNLSEDKVLEIRSAGFRSAFLALDKDAFELTIKYAAQWRFLLQLVPIKILKDLKDMDEDELKEIVNGITPASSKPS